MLGHPVCTSGPIVTDCTPLSNRERIRVIAARPRRDRAAGARSSPWCSARRSHSRAHAAPTGRPTCSASSCSARLGLTLWNGQWYSGHYTLGYSVIYPPLASWFGPMVIGIASSVIAAAAFADLLQRRFGTVGADGRVLVRRRHRGQPGRRPAPVRARSGVRPRRADWRTSGDGSSSPWSAAPLTSLASPVAGAFLAIGLGGIVVDAMAAPAQRRTRAVQGPDRDGRSSP